MAITTQSLPFTLPGAYVYLPGVVPQPDVDTGGYDVSIGGYGFRLATDQQNPYQRVTEPTTNQRFDNSSEPGEQSLSPLPWTKSQESFHAGAGQLNLEQGFTAFQYEREQVSHVRFDTCLGVDVWTGGKVKRLPTTTVTSAGGRATACMVAFGDRSGNDFIVGGGLHSLYRVSFPSGVDTAGTLTDYDLSGYGGSSNVTVQSLATDGQNVYALLQLAADGTATGANVRTAIVSMTSSSTALTLLYKGPADSTQHPGIVGWAKARLVAGLDNKLYELSPTAAAAALPTAIYTHPSASWLWTALSESPSAVLMAGVAGTKPDILAFALNTSGAAPVLSGGASVGNLPNGEIIYSMGSVLGSFLALGTARGVHIGTYDTYSGTLKIGPLSVETTAPVYGIASRDRFVYAGYTNQQQDGKTGLCRIDVSYIVDASGRNAWAPDLRPPTTAATGLGTVIAVDALPWSNRMVWYSTDGFHVEGNGPSADGDAWIQTSRIRYGTTEQKLFKSGRIAGTLDSASVTVTAIQPFSSAVNVGTFGFLVDGNPGDFYLPTGLSEWTQLRFGLNGAGAVLDSYQVKAYPAPKVQDVITLTANCFVSEVDRAGLEVIDPQQPRARFEAVRQLKLAGTACRYVEYTNQGAVALTVLIDQIAFQSYSRPSTETDFGGYVTMKLRVV